MERDRFTANSPGRLAETVTTTGKDWSFIPNQLPSDWAFDPNLWPLLVEAHKALGTLNGIGQTLADPRLLLRPLQNQEAISSSSIEGTYVTAEQLLLYELNPIETNKSNALAADWMEVLNYSKALQHGCELLKEMPLCGRLIKEMHAILMRGVRGRNKAPGKFRRIQVQVGSNSRFVPPPHTEVVRLMANLEKYINDQGNSQSALDPLVKAFIAHYQFESIHPFMDGNGRIGRCILSLMTYQWLQHTHPWLYLSAFFEKFKEEYVDNLFKVSTVGDWSSWIAFCLRGTIHQAMDSIRRCHLFNDIRKKYHELVAANAPSARTHGIIENLFIDPFVTVSSIASKCNVTYPTAKTDIDHLVKLGILKQLKGRKPKAFCCFQVFNVAYHEDGDNG